MTEYAVEIQSDFPCQTLPEIISYFICILPNVSAPGAFPPPVTL